MPRLASEHSIPHTYTHYATAGGEVADADGGGADGGGYMIYIYIYDGKMVGQMAEGASLQDALAVHYTRYYTILDTILYCTIL